MTDDKIIVELYHILLLLIPIAAAALTLIGVVWKYLVSPQICHRHKISMAVQIVTKDVRENSEKIKKLEADESCSRRRVYGHLDEIKSLVASIDKRTAHMEGQLEIMRTKEG